MSLQRVHHIVVRVKDLDQGIASYQAMGLALERTAENAALGIKQAFSPGGWLIHRSLLADEPCLGGRQGAGEPRRRNSLDRI